MNSDVEEMEIENASKIGFRELLIMQFSKCTNYQNVEFRGGYFTSFTTRNGDEKEIYVPDTREIFCNAVYALSMLMKPRFSETMQEQYDNIMKLLEKIKSEFINNSTVNEQVVLGEGYYDNPVDKLLLDTYKNKKLQIYLKFFMDLTKEMDDKKYYESGLAEYS